IERSIRFVAKNNERLGSSLDNQVQLSFKLQDFYFDPIACSIESQVGPRLTDSELMNLQVVDKFRKSRSDDTQTFIKAIRLKPQQSYQEIRYCARGPGLRLARDRIGNRNAVIIAMESAE